MLVLVQAETWSQDLAPKLQYIKTDRTFGNSRWDVLELSSETFIYHHLMDKSLEDLKDNLVVYANTFS
jgi:hypothetical protein